MTRSPLLSASAELNLARLASLAERIAAARQRLQITEQTTEPAVAPVSAMAPANAFLLERN